MSPYISSAFKLDFYETQNILHFRFLFSNSYLDFCNRNLDFCNENLDFCNSNLYLCWVTADASYKCCHISLKLLSFPSSLSWRGWFCLNSSDFASCWPSWEISQISNWRILFLHIAVRFFTWLIQPIYNQQCLKIWKSVRMKISDWILDWILDRILGWIKWL